MKYRKALTATERERERERKRERECRRLDSEGQPALLIIDVFRGQMTQPVLDLLKENDILLLRVSSRQHDGYISALRSHRKQIGKVIL